MATTNKKETTNTKVENEKESQEIQELKKMMEDKNAENNELREMIKQLSEIVKANSMAASQTNMQNIAPEFDDELVYINNNSIGKQIMPLDSLGNTSLEILASEENRPIEKNYIRQAMQVNKVRRLFEYGILEFCDEKFYKVYGIERRFDMSEKNVLDLFSKEKLSSTTAEVAQLFKRPDSSALKHELAYKTLDLYDKGKFPAEDTATIILALNKLFCSKINYNFEDLVANLPYKRGDYK